MTYQAPASTASLKIYPKQPYAKIFVAGCPRSGTTWTAHMIERHPSVIKLNGESHLYKLFYDPFTYLKTMPLRQRLKRRSWILKHYGPIPILTGFNSNNLWEGLLRIYRFYEWSGESSGPHMAIDYETFTTLVRKARASKGDDLRKITNLIKSILDTSFYAQGGDSNHTMLEKTPMHIKFASTILKSFPEAKMIEVVRDIRSICASWQARAKTQRWARRPTAELVEQWIRCIEAGDKVVLSQKERSQNRAQDDTATCDDTPSPIGDRIIRLKYENLRQDPNTWLSTTFNFAALPTHSGHISEIVDALSIENARQKGDGLHVRQGRVQGWKEELSAEDIETCHRLAGPTLERLGYAM